MTDRCILVAMADSHGGNQLGLLNPETVLWREGPDGEAKPWRPALTATQELLWALYLEQMGQVIELAGGDDIVLFHAGDLSQGIRYVSLLVSNRIADQFIIAEMNLLPWLQYPNVQTMRLAMGTASHVFGDGSTEVLVAHELQARFPERDIKPLYHGLADVRGVTVDYAHHGPGPGIRDWTAGNQVRYYLKSLVAGDSKAGKDPARLVLRGHYHTYRRETIYERLAGEDRTFDMVLLPSYCGMGDHGHQATRSAFTQHFGLVAFELAYSQLIDVHPLRVVVDLRTREML